MGSGCATCHLMGYSISVWETLQFSTLCAGKPAALEGIARKSALEENSRGLVGEKASCSPGTNTPPGSTPFFLQHTSGRAPGCHVIEVEAKTLWNVRG